MYVVIRMFSSSQQTNEKFVFPASSSLSLVFPASSALSLICFLCLKDADFFASFLYKEFRFPFAIFGFVFTFI
jgi:hypothetical protein